MGRPIAYAIRTLAEHEGHMYNQWRAEHPDGSVIEWGQLGESKTSFVQSLRFRGFRVRIGKPNPR